jgi:hypothetical protein
MRALVIAFLAACNSAPPPPPAAAPTPPATVPPPTPSASAPPASGPEAACLPRITQHHALATVTLRRGSATVEACYALADQPGGDSACLAVDVETRDVRTVSSHVRPPALTQPKFSVEPVGNDLRVCPQASTSCATVKLGYKAPLWAGNPGPVATVNEDGTRAIVIVGERVGKDGLKVYADTFEVKTSQRVSRVPLTGALGKDTAIFQDPTNIWGIRWPGKWAVAIDSVSAGPGAGHVLFNPQGGNVRFLHGYQGSFVRAVGDTFVSIDKKTLSLVDVSTGTVGAGMKLPGEGIDDPESEVASTIVVGDQPYVIVANPPAILRVDLGKKALVDEWKLPLCP